MSAATTHHFDSYTNALKHLRTDLGGRILFNGRNKQPWSLDLTQTEKPGIDQVIDGFSIAFQERQENLLQQYGDWLREQAMPLLGAKFAVDCEIDEYLRKYFIEGFCGQDLSDEFSEMRQAYVVGKSVRKSNDLTPFVDEMVKEIRLEQKYSYQQWAKMNFLF